jgi:GntR family uxuAB operon transcriptional repressor
MEKSVHPIGNRRYVQVAQQILQQVTRGEATPGDRLPSDRDLALQFEVSRATVREALLALELLGVVAARHGEGVYFTEPLGSIGRRFGSPLDVPPGELLETRAEIEPVIAALSAGRMDRHRLSNLYDLVDESAALVDDVERLPDFVRLGLRFHSELAPGCGNRVLADIGCQLTNLEAHPLWALVNQLCMRTRDARQGQVLEHREILDAIDRQDDAAASVAMTAHLNALMGQIFGTTRRPAHQPAM